MHNVETKQQKYLRENAEREQIEIDKNDADKILKTLLSAMPGNYLPPIREIVKHPHELAPLIQPRDRGVVCFFVLHAALLILAHSDMNDILNEMNSEDIDELRKLISIAQKYSRPNANNITDNIKDRIAKDTIGATHRSESEKIQNKIMIESLKIYAYVTQTDANWNGAVNELKKWANAIDSRVNINKNKTKKQSYTPAQPQAISDACALEIRLQTFIDLNKSVYKQLDNTVQKRDSIQLIISSDINNDKFQELFTQLDVQQNTIYTYWKTLNQITLARGILDNLHLAMARKASAEKSLRDTDQALQFASNRAKIFLESLEQTTK